MSKEKQIENYEEGTQTEFKMWVEETHRDTFKASYASKRTCFEGRSPFQSVHVVETTGFGKMLLNDGLVMVTERDEFVYHEMIAHVPLFTHPNPKKVLIIGGGDGGTAREVLRHKSVERCVMIEIDEMVTRACQEHIPQTAACLDQDSRMDLRFIDGVKFVAEIDEKFDVVLVDSSDPFGPATPLFGEKFYKDVNRVLDDSGIVVSQAESPFYEPEAQQTMMSILKGQFPSVRFYNYSNLTYPGGLWSFSFATKKFDPVADLDDARVSEANLEMKYYSPDIHRAAFANPEFQKKNLTKS